MPPRGCADAQPRALRHLTAARIGASQFTLRASVRCSALLGDACLEGFTLSVCHRTLSTGTTHLGRRHRTRFGDHRRMSRLAGCAVGHRARRGPTDGTLNQAPNSPAAAGRTTPGTTQNQRAAPLTGGRPLHRPAGLRSASGTTWPDEASGLNLATDCLSHARCALIGTTVIRRQRLRSMEGCHRTLSASALPRRGPRY